MEDCLYTIQETSKILKTNTNYVYDLIDYGFLPALKLGRLKVRRNTLMKFLEINEGNDLTDLKNVKKLKIKGGVTNEEIKNS